MSLTCRILLIAALSTFPLTGSAAPVAGGFFENHCIKCHGPDKEKGDLRLDRLPNPAEHPDALEAWARVLDAIETGEMPPEDETQPGASEISEAASAIADAVARATSPAPALRRLNRYEYENSVHELLGIDIPLAELLPEDGVMQGFDNVATGLSISPVLMERYLEAADVAFEATVRRFPPLPAKTRRCDVLQGEENQDSVAKKKGGVLESEGALVKFTPGWPPVRIDEVHPIEDGIYRCRIAVWPYQPGERTLALAVYAGPLFGPGKRRYVGHFDVTGSAEAPRVIEFESFLGEGETLHLVPWVFPEHVTWRDKEEPRPGIAVAWAETHGPLDQAFPSEAQRALFGDRGSLSMVEGTPIWMRHRKGVKMHHVESSAPETDVEAIVRSFVGRAFRRPVGDALADQFVALALDRLRAGRTFEDAVRAGVTAVLCSPHFLLVNAEAAVDDFTIASRMSYFLWSSMPDDELLALAGAGKLADPAVRREQVERMVGDPKIERFVRSFTGQWLDLREIEFTTPDKKLYPEFDPLLQESMLRETRGFFRHVLDEDLPVTSFIDARFSILNERLAAHYGIPGVKGHERSQRVALPGESVRGGILTQASVLKVTANGTATSPILRGVWILDKIFGQPAPPPPPGVPAVEPDIRGATSIRDQIEKHRADPSCARCHQRIDPPGFALEAFDPIGGERTYYRSLGEGERATEKANYTVGPDVDASGTLPEGARFNGFSEFRDLLVQDGRRVERALAQKLLVYGTGRPFSVADRPALDSILHSAGADPGLRALVHAVVASDAFVRP